MNPQNQLPMPPQSNNGGQSGGPVPQQPQFGPPAPVQPYYPPQNQTPQPIAQAFPANPAATPAPPEQYEFIMNPNQAAKKFDPFGALKGGSTLKLVGVICGAVIVLIIIIIAASSLFSGSKDYTSLVTVAEDQTELIRIAALATDDATGQSTSNLAYNAKLSLTSSQQQLLAYLANNGTKVGAKQLSLKQSAQTTTTLKNAIATSSFDSAFNDSMKTDLTTYSNDLETAYKTNPGPKGKDLLNKSYGQAQLLLKQTAQASGD